MLPSPDRKVCNAEAQVGDYQSVFNWWKRLIALRKEKEVLVSALLLDPRDRLDLKLARVFVLQTYGRFEMLSDLHEDVFAYTRQIIKSGSDDKETVLVILNFRDRAVEYEVPTEVGDLENAQYIVGSYEATKAYSPPQFKGSSITLQPFEGLLYQI
jgi:oligo-1,6-glucosidase